MTIYCCRPRLIEAGVGDSNIRIDVEDRVTLYKPRGVIDPLPLALRGGGSLHLVLSCSSVCASSVFGEAGELLREASGTSFIIEYERRDGFERLRVEGSETEIHAQEGVVELRPYIEFSAEELQRCISGEAAKILAERLTSAARQGIKLPGGSILGYSRLLAGLVLNPIAKRLTRLGGPGKPCIEAIVSRRVWEEAAPVIVAAILLEDYLDRVVIAYPVNPQALKSWERSELGDYGEGLAYALSEHANLVSLYASRLLGRSVIVEKVGIDGYAVPIVTVDNVKLHDLYSASLALLALSLAAALASKRSMILALDAPVEKLNRRSLVELVEKNNSVLLYTRL